MKRELLIKYLLHEANTSEKKEILEWIQESEKNANTLFEMQQIIEQETIESFRQDQENALERLYKQNRQQKQEKLKEKYKGILSPLMHIAAVFIIGLLTFGGYHYFFSKDINENDLYITLQTDDKAQVQEVTLPDGSLLCLNKNTVVSYKKDFNDNIREVKLEKGEAYFDIKRDETKPFIVHTDNYLVEVLGTKFSINTNNNEEISETTLVEGSIRLLTPAKTPLITLEKGQKALYEPGSAELRIKEVNAITEVAWKDGLFIFTNTPIREICEYLNKEYSIEINSTAVDPALSFTGEFKRTNNIESILEMLEYTGKIKYKKEGNRITLFH